MQFKQNTANTVYFMVVDSSGVAQTGASLVSVYYSATGVPGVLATVVAISFTEVESVNMPGVYSVLVTSAFNSIGPVALTVNTDLGLPYNVMGEVVAITNQELFDSQDSISSLLTSVDDTVNNTDLIVGSLEITVNDTNAKVTALDNTSITELLKDIRALAGQAGFRISSATYDGSNQLLTATIAGYEPGADPDAAVPRVTLELAAVYNGSGQMTQYTVKEP